MFRREEHKRRKVHFLPKPKTALSMTKWAAFNRPVPQRMTPKEKTKIRTTCEIYPSYGDKVKLFECRCGEQVTYFCGICSLKVFREHITNHLTDLRHQKIQRVAVQVTEKDYRNISKQSYHAAQKILDELSFHRYGKNKYTSVPIPPTGAAKVSAAHRAQHERNVKDNFEAHSPDSSTGLLKPRTSVKVGLQGNPPTKPFKMAHQYKTQLQHSSNTSNIAHLQPVSKANAKKRIFKEPVTPEKSAVGLPLMPNSPKRCKVSSSMAGSPISSCVTTSETGSTSLGALKPRTLKNCTETTPNPVPLTQTSVKCKVGLDQLIIVTWARKQQVYCKLCSVRLQRSDHAGTLTHQYNYVKLKYPAANPSELDGGIEGIVSCLAEVEKKLGSHIPQKMEVTKDVYQKLAALPEGEAVERVKAMARAKDSKVSSSGNSANTGARDVTSSCEISSSYDGATIPHDGPPASSESSINLDTPTERQKLLDQIKETKFQLKETVDLIVNVHGQNDPMEVCELTQYQLPTSTTLNKLCTSPTPDESDDVVFVSEMFKQDVIVIIDDDDETQSDVEACTGVAELLDESEQEPKGHVSSWKPQMDQNSNVKTTFEGSSAHPGPVDLDGLQAKAISNGKIIQGSSNLSIFLKAGVEDAKPVIGIGLVWECRGIALETFFLCESCQKTLFLRDICQHMRSLDHKLGYIRKQYPTLLQMFWNDEALSNEEKNDLLNVLVLKLYAQEKFSKVDAQCVLLGKELHHSIKTSSFTEALKMMNWILSGEKSNDLTGFTAMDSTPPSVENEDGGTQKSVDWQFFSDLLSMLKRNNTVKMTLELNLKTVP